MKRRSERVPPGTYKVVCAGHELYKARTKGTEAVVLSLEILEPSKVKDPSSGKTVRTKGKVIGHAFWLTPLTVPYNAQNARAILGRPVKRLKRVTSWVGKTCEIDVKDDIFNGVTRSRVNVFKPWAPATVRGAR